MDKASSVSESLSSSHSLSAPFSIRSQTKDKFDALLKKAQKKKARSVSKEKLLTDLESNASVNEPFDERNTVETINLKELNSEGNYILNKFLGEESITSVKEVKAPVPKPRQIKKYISPTESQGTFNVTSPKFLKSDEEKDSSSSKKTYDVNKVVANVLVHKSSNSNSVTSNCKKKGKLKESKQISKESSDSSVTDDEKIEIVTETTKKIDKVKDNNEQTDKKSYKYKNIVEIWVHQTDRLELDSLVIHPVVKIHIVDAASGKYLPKSDKSRSVVFFYENDDNDYISPVMTHSYNLQEKRILNPSWEENILINEDYEYFKDESSRIIIFFEILDFVSAQMMQTLKNKNCANGWHKIAFAFFKLSGKDGTLNIGKRVRLQLYYPSRSKKSDQVCEPWVWWKKKKLKKYPSTLHVSIKPMVSPLTVVESFRSKTPIQRESSSKTKLCDDLNEKEVPEKEPIIHSSKTDLREAVKLENSNWSRKSGEICKLPNKSLTELNSYDCGCFVMKFSNAGKYLACAVQIDSLFYVVVYSILTLREVNKLSPHQALIYDIKWSHDDSLLLSASADNTVCIFDITTWSFLQILPHPNFVYACDIRENVIASGCFDGTVRIWSCVENNAKIIDFRLTQELEGHSGYVTTLCFSKKGAIFSADSSGVIMEWQREKSDWTQKRQISLLDLKETVINQILLFAKERKLIVNSRDSTIRIVDVKSGCVLQWLRGGLNRRFQMYCSVSPCGNFIFNGSENGSVNVWNSKNGHQIATYSPFLPKNQFTVIHCVNFHPCDNILTISHYGKNLPILIYTHDKELSQPSVGLTINEEFALSTEPTNDKAKKTLQKIATEQLSLRRKTQDKTTFRDVLEKMDIVITASK